jgi:hypothetical protein
MKIKITDRIGAATKGTRKAHSKAPGDFNAAACFAFTHALKLGEPLVLVPGNSYMSKVWHVARATDDLLKFGVGRQVLGAHIALDGTVSYAELDR